ncbi:UNVERIFIED_CONTAM: hypothetical protein FKN15_052993 [Acipenser sinensis]
MASMCQGDCISPVTWSYYIYLHIPEGWIGSFASRDTEAAWPPCVRVTVVRSPVLQTGTLFVITADNPATIGREKDMQHAIRIPELGVSKIPFCRALSVICLLLSGLGVMRSY